MIQDWYREEKPDTDQLDGALPDSTDQGPTEYWLAPADWLPQCHSLDDLKRRRHNPEIVCLDLSNSRFGDADLDSLRGLPSLEMLILNDTPITDAGLKRLQQQSHPKLTKLWIAGTRITDEGLYSVGQMAGLRDLALGDRITDAGLEKLLPLKNLEALWLGNNDNITDAGVRCVGRFSGLSALDVGSEKISDAGIAQLKDSKHIYDLRLRCQGMTDAGMAHLRGVRQLGFLQLESDRLTDAGMPTIRSFPRLVAFKLRGDQVTGAGLPHFRGFLGLRDLALCGKRIGDEAIKHLKRNHDLYSLTLCGDEITDAGLAVLRGQTIDELHIGGARLTDACLEQVRHIDGLRRLDLLNCSVRGRGLRHIKDMVEDRTGLNTGIQELCLRGAGDEMMECAAELPAASQPVPGRSPMHQRRLCLS